MFNISEIQLILVPQGVEYQAVCQGLNLNYYKPQVLAIPIGCKSLTKHLEKLQQSGYFFEAKNVLLMGLCGSLSIEYTVGDIVIYRECINESSITQACNHQLTNLVSERLKNQALVTGLTSDRIIHLASEKKDLGKIYKSEVVDMEGWATLAVLQKADIAVAMVRIISDDIRHNLPNLNSAISADGALLPLPLAVGMMRQPIAATRLIRGSLYGLKVLQQATRQLFLE